ncbi:hypothetical protein [Sphingomonas sp.]
MTLAAAVTRFPLQRQLDVIVDAVWWLSGVIGASRLAIGGLGWSA